MAARFPYSRLVLSLAAAFAVAGCGQGAEEGSGGLTAQLRSQCIAQVEGTPIDPEAAGEVCDCAARKAQEDLDVGDLISGDTTQIRTIVAQCAEEFMSGGETDASADEAEVQ